MQNQKTQIVSIEISLPVRTGWRIFSEE